MKATGIVRRIDDLGRVVIPESRPNDGIDGLAREHFGYEADLFSLSACNVLWKGQPIVTSILWLSLKINV
jgi:hypothetical protein